MGKAGVHHPDWDPTGRSQGPLPSRDGSGERRVSTVLRQPAGSLPDRSVTRRFALAHPRNRESETGAASPAAAPRRPQNWLGNWLAARRAEGSQGTRALAGLRRHCAPGRCALSSRTELPEPPWGRVPRPPRHAGPLTAVAVSGLVEVGVSLHSEAELGVALAPRALSPQDAAAVALRLGHFVQGLVGEGQRRGQGQRQGQQRWTPAQPQGRRGQPHPRGPPTLCRCCRPSQHATPARRGPRGSETWREAGAQSRETVPASVWRLCGAELS